MFACKKDNNTFLSNDNSSVTANDEFARTDSVDPSHTNNIGVACMLRMDFLICMKRIVILFPGYSQVNA
ncbi:MAG: hypothetical protein ABJA79_04305 [Parafilimonas sp.]